MQAVFKVFIEFVLIMLLFCVLGFLAARHVGSLAPDQGLNPYCLYWANLNPGPQGSPWWSILKSSQDLPIAWM